MEYNPINEDEKQEWIAWLRNQVEILNGKEEIEEENSIFETDNGDVATAKDLVGNLLALLTNKTITID